MWSQIVNLPVEECMRRIREMELDSYMRVVSVLRAKGAPHDAERKVLTQLATLLNVSDDRANAELRRVANDEVLATISKRRTGRDWSKEWRNASGERTMCGRLMRVPVQTVNSPLADRIGRLIAAKFAKRTITTQASPARCDSHRENALRDKMEVAASTKIIAPCEEESCSITTQVKGETQAVLREQDEVQSSSSRVDQDDEDRLAISTGEGEGVSDEAESIANERVHSMEHVARIEVATTCGASKSRRRSSVDDKVDVDSCSDITSSPLLPSSPSPSLLSSEDGRLLEDIEEIQVPSPQCHLAVDSRISVDSLTETEKADATSPATDRIDFTCPSGFQDGGAYCASPFFQGVECSESPQHPSLLQDGVGDAESPSSSTLQDDECPPTFSTSLLCPNRRRLPECRVVLNRAPPLPYKRMRRKSEGDPVDTPSVSGHSSITDNITWSSSSSESPVPEIAEMEEVSKPLGTDCVGANVVISGDSDAKNLENNEEDSNMENLQTVDCPQDLVEYGNLNSCPNAISLENSGLVDSENSQSVGCDSKLVADEDSENSSNVIGLENSEIVISSENTHNVGCVPDSFVYVEDQNGSFCNRATVNTCIVPVINKSSATNPPTSLPMNRIPVSCIISKSDGSNIRIFKLRHDPSKTRFIKVNSSQNQLRGLVHKLLANKRKLEEGLGPVSVVHSPLKKRMDLNSAEDCRKKVDFANSSYDGQNYGNNETHLGEESLSFDNIPGTTVVRNCLAERSRQFNVIATNVHKPECNDTHRSPYVPETRI